MKEEARYLKKIEKISFNPVFILGLPRSGTSILYKTLVSTGCFNYADIYDILEYDNLLKNKILDMEKRCREEIDEFFSKYDINNRGVDLFETKSTTPEEYGFILNNKTSSMYTNKKNIDLLDEICKKIQFISEEKKPILLKNPHDIPRFLFIKEMWPDSKFIFIHRHPFYTINSGLNTERFLYKEKPIYHSKIDSFYEKIYNYYLAVLSLRVLYNKLTPLGIIYITNFLKKYIKYFLENIDYLEESSFINIKYEDLCDKPNDTVQKILNFLDLEKIEKRDFNDLINKRNLPLDTTVLKMRGFIYKKTEKFFEYNNYRYY